MKRTITASLAICMGAGMALPAHGFLSLNVLSGSADEPAEETAYETGDTGGFVSGDLLPERYIVTLDPEIEDILGLGGLGDVLDTLLVAVGGGEIIHTYETALTGAALRLTDTQAEILAGLPGVAAVEQDQVVAVNSVTQPNATWGLDRSDQRQLPLDGQFTYPAHGGDGVNVYILDTGLRTSHEDFEGRVIEGRNFAVNDTGLLGLGGLPLLGPILNIGGETDPEDVSDCNGHGTHVASSAVGTEYGIAKSSSVAAVRVLDCSGAGSNADVIAGVDWVAENHEAPAVANMSLGGGDSAALDQAVENAVAEGVTFVVAAGNNDADACSGSPNRVSEAITVGSTNSDDERSSFSNHGSCVDIFAPGSDITAAWHTGDTDTNTISGTSMAAPHVAGAAALVLHDEPSASPASVMDQIVGDSTEGVLSNLTSGSPDRLLFVPSP